MFGLDGKDSLQNIPIWHLRVLRPMICNGMWISFALLFYKNQEILADVLNILVSLASNFQSMFVCMFVEALQGTSQSRVHGVIFGQSRHHFIHVSHAITPYFLIDHTITLILLLQSRQNGQFFTHSRHYAKFS